MAFQKGNNANPLGAKAHRSHGFANWKTRVTQLQTKYPTLDKLMALYETDVETGELKPKKALMQCNPIDVGIIEQLIGQAMAKDKRLWQEMFWDRMDGKPKENKTHRIVKSPEDLTDEEIEAWLADE